MDSLSVREMKQVIIAMLEESGDSYTELSDENIVHVFNLYINGTLIVSTDPHLNLYYGLYYQNIQSYDEMKKHYDIAISGNNVEAMANIAFYYDHVEQNYPMMIKYCKLAIKLGFVDAMIYLAVHYEAMINTNRRLKLPVNQSDLMNAEKYYKMAFAKDGNPAHLIAFYSKNRMLSKLSLYRGEDIDPIVQIIQDWKASDYRSSRTSRIRKHLDSTSKSRN